MATPDPRYYAALLMLVASAGCGTGETSATPAGAADSGSTADATVAADAQAAQQDTAGRARADTTDTAAATPVETNTLVGPTVLVDANDDPNVVEVTLVAGTAKIKLFDDLPAMDLYAYNGQIPGPTLHAKVGDKVIVHFENHLPEATTVHWHGLRISDQMDGNPRIQNPVKAGEKFTYTFTVNDASTYWYHPHVRANEQVEKGLYGAIVIDEAKKHVVRRERVLVMDDILVDKDGKLPAFLGSHPEVMHGRSGNRLLINGKQSPQKATAKLAEIERWRIVNTANARTMHFDFTGQALVRVVGTDGGLLEKPYILEKPLTLPVGGRYDLEVLYGAVGDVTMRSLVAVVGANNQLQYKPYAQLIVTVEDDPSAPARYKTPFPGADPLPKRTAVDTAVMTFKAVEDKTSPTGVAWLINDKKFWMDKPLFTFIKGNTIDMTLKNLAGPEHPFHLHGQFFEILEPAGYPGLKDTVLVPGMTNVKIRAYFDNPGQWMAHCHILGHAAQGMMAEIVVKDQ